MWKLASGLKGVIGARRWRGWGKLCPPPPTPLVNFKLPLPGKVTSARPSAVLACFASPPLGMDIISRGLQRRLLRFAPCECGLPKKKKKGFVSPFFWVCCRELAARESVGQCCPSQTPSALPGLGPGHLCRGGWPCASWGDRPFCWKSVALRSPGRRCWGVRGVCVARPRRRVRCGLLPLGSRLE